MTNLSDESAHSRSLDQEDFRAIVVGQDRMPELLETGPLVVDASLETELFTIDDARTVTILYMEERLDIEGCRTWSDFILSTSKVMIADDYQPILLEFLAEWSERKILIDRRSVGFWQGVFDNYQSDGTL